MTCRLSITNGIGQRLGEHQGLDLLRHIRRVSPRTRLIAYTSRSLAAAEAEFFRASHIVLPKDMGLGDSMALVENQLQLAVTIEHLFEALLTKLSVSDPEERPRIRVALFFRSMTQSGQRSPMAPSLPYSVFARRRSLRGPSARVTMRHWRLSLRATTNVPSDSRHAPFSLSRCTGP